MIGLPALISHSVSFMFFRFITYFFRILISLIVVFSIYLYVFFSGHLYRIFQFWWWVTRPFANYYYIRKSHDWGWMDEAERQKRLTAAHKIYAPYLSGLFLTLRGFFIKVAQRMSTRPDMYPVEFINEFDQFLANCPSEPFSIVEETIRKELGGELSEFFLKVHKKPLGAASIGQAHRATLKDGREVVIKVQYPWVAKLIMIDFYNFLFVAWFFDGGEYKYLQGIMKIFMDELDFTREGRVLKYLSDEINKAFDPKRVRVPRPIPELCTDHVLVMEYFKGELLSKYCKEARKGRDLRKTDFKEFTPPDEIQLKVIRGLVELRQSMWNTLAISLNNSFGRAFNLLGNKTNKIVTYLNSLDINVDDMLQTLIDVTGYQILVLGTFNTDPHAGNILVDEKGCLGLIDFGQTYESSVDERKAVARLMLALLRRNKDESVRLMLEMGFKTKSNDPNTLFLLGVFFFDCMDYTLAEKMLGTKDRREMMRTLRKDRITDFPPEFYGFIRVSMVLRGVCLNFLTAPSFAALWEKYCVQILGAGAVKRKRGGWFSKLSSIALKTSSLAFPKAQLKFLLK